jgi:hypothetical protein
MSYAFRPLLLILAIALVAPAHARDDERDESRERQNAGDRVREVERDGGRVLQAEPMQRSGREVYRLKVLTPEGRVRVLDDSRRGDRPRPEARREAPPSADRSDEPGRRDGRGDDDRS